MAFTRGKCKSILLGIQGLVGHRTAPNWDFLYTASATKHPKYEIGDRVVTPDGRSFRYAYAGYLGITSCNFGVKNSSVLVACRDDASAHTNEVVVPSVAIGEKEVTLTFTAGTLGDSTSNSHSERTGVVAKDELRGGYVVFLTGEHQQNRGIIGNSAVAIGDTTMTLYLDAALNYALTAGTSLCMILGNPYGNVIRSSGPWFSVVGVPNVTCSAGDYVWLQTWGPLRVTPITDACVGNAREFVFDQQGAVVPFDDSLGSAISYQHAGFLLERHQTTDSYEQGPFIMLQITP